jgi:type I restriction enzyme S subunit
MSWETMKLSECCVSIADGDHLPPPKADNGVPFVTISNINSSNQFDFENTMYVPQEYYDKLDAKRKAQIGDVLYSVVGSFGIPVYIKESQPFVFQRHIAILRPNESILPRFLYYTMLSSAFYSKADAAAIGAAQRTVSLTALRNMEIDVPSLEEQRRIVNILSAYDDLIENNQKQIKLLEEAAQRLYKEWFVDLRFPGYEDVETVDGVPEGWKKVSIEDVCDTIGGGTPSTKNDDYYRDGHIKWVTPTDITRKNSLILLDTEKRITEEGLRNSSAKMLPPYTILMTSRASVGFFGLCEYEVCTNQGFISCVPYKENLRFFLLYNLMERVDEIRSKAGGSTFLEISKKNFRELGVILPPNDILDLFSKIVTPIVSQIEIHTKSIKGLQEARDRLLPKLMSGEMEV